MILKNLLISMLEKQKKLTTLNDIIMKDVRLLCKIGSTSLSAHPSLVPYGVVLHLPTY